MDDSNHKYTSAEKDPLHKDADSEPCCKEWNCCSVVGMMLYLADSTYQNIVYAVHHRVQFSHSSKCSHKMVIKYITRYLKGTRTNGLMMKPDLRIYSLICLQALTLRGVVLLKTTKIRSVWRVVYESYLDLVDFLYYGAQNFNLGFNCLP